MAAQTYDILFNLIANVQGFRNAETRINRLNRAIDRLDRRLRRTSLRFAHLGGASTLVGGTGGAFVGGIPTGSGLGTAGAAAFGAAVGTAGISPRNRRDRSAGSYRREFVRKMPRATRAAFGSVYPVRSAAYAGMDAMHTGSVMARRGARRFGDWSGLRAEQRYNPNWTYRMASGINRSGGFWGALGLGIGGYLGVKKSIQVQQQRQQEQLKAFTLANPAERRMFFPPNFDPSQTNEIWMNMAQQYAVPQQSLSEMFAMGKTYGLPFDQFLESADDFGKFSAGLSVYATDSQRRIRAMLAMGQMWQNDIIEMRDARQLMELGVPLQELLLERKEAPVSLREGLEAQQRMTDEERESFRRGMLQTIFDHLTGKDTRLGDIIQKRPALLFGALEKLTDTSNQLFKSFGEGLDDQGQFTFLLNQMNESLRNAIPAMRVLGENVTAIVNSLVFGTGKTIGTDDNWSWYTSLLEGPSWSMLASPLAYGALAVDPYHQDIKGPRMKAEDNVKDWINVNINNNTSATVSVSSGGKGASKFKMGNGFLGQ